MKNRRKEKKSGVKAIARKLYKNSLVIFLMPVILYYLIYFTRIFLIVIFHSLYNVPKLSHFKYTNCSLSCAALFSFTLFWYKTDGDVCHLSKYTGTRPHFACYAESGKTKYTCLLAKLLIH